MGRRTLLAGLLAAALLLCAPSGLAKKKKKRAERYGVIAGTVFQNTGLSLRGARVTLTPVPAGGSPAKKKQIQRTRTDSRGEFAFRVPAGAMRYTVRAEADGWEPAEKTVEVQWDQRVDIVLRLRPAAAAGKGK